MRVADRIAPGLRVDAAALPACLECLSHGEIEPLETPGSPPVGTGDAGIPDERHVTPRGQGAATFDRHDRRQRFRLVGGIGWQTLRLARLLQEIAKLPVILAQPVDDRRRDFGLQHVDRDFLADTVDRAIGIGPDRRRRRRNICCDEEHLFLLNARIIAAKHPTRRRPACIDGKAARAFELRTARRGEAVVQVDFARQPARQRLFEIIDERLRIDPPPVRADRAGQLGRRGRTRIAERHHGLRKAHGEAFDRAAVRPCRTGCREDDLRRGAADGDERCRT